MAPHVVVRFAELVVRKESAKGCVKCTDGLQKRYGVVVELVFVLIQTICDGNDILSLLVAVAVAA